MRYFCLLYLYFNIYNLINYFIRDLGKEKQKISSLYSVWVLRFHCKFERVAFV